MLDASALTRLPDLPQVIDLDLKGCSSLIELPELSPNLVSLELGGCTSLRSLPAQRPPRLTILDVSGCRALTTLPAWVNELSYFIGPAVEPARREQGTREPLTHSAREPLAMLRLDHHFNHLMAEQPHEAWFRRAGRSEQDIARLRHDWDRLRGENGHGDFQILLRRLGELGGRSETVKALPQTVAAVIAEVAQAPADSRKLILAAAEGAGADCHDRVLTCFNDVQAQVEASRLQRSGAGESALLDLASRLFRQTLLDEATTQVIRRQWQQGRRAANSTNDGPNTREALEVQLALREHLGAELDLPFQAYGMHTTEQLTLLNTSDLEFAREQVQRAFVEEHRLAAGLAQQAMWRRYLEQQPGVAAALKAVSAPFEQQMADLDDRLALPADAPDALGSEAVSDASQ